MEIYLILTILTFDLSNFIGHFSVFIDLSDKL